MTSLILAAAVTASAGAVLAQRIDRDSRLSDSLYQEFVIQLDDESQAVADEYLDILESIQELVEDYQVYLEELDQKNRQEQDISIDELRRGLAEKTYADDPQLLIDDIHQVINNIKDVEATQKAKHNTNQPSTTRVIRNLRRELVVMVDLIEDHADKQLGTVLKRLDVQKYVQIALERVARSMAEAESRAEEATREFDKRLSKPLPPEPPGTDPRKIPQSEPWPDFWFAVPSNDDAGTIRRFEDSVTVTDRAARLYIQNPSGSVVISGSEDRNVHARLGLEVASRTTEREEAFADKADLQVRRVAHGYEITAILPRISDPETRLLRSVLHVAVPSSNPVTCESSHGKVLISGLSGGLRVNCGSATISLEQIEGGVEVENSMGEVLLESVKGAIVIQNAYSPIQLIECQGDFKLANSYAAINLIDTYGPADISNSGEVSVSNHKGSVVVDNSYGMVTVVGVTGDVEIANAYQQVKVSRISGSATLSNTYSQITAEQVGGRVLASTVHGSFTGKLLTGPIDCTVESGSLELTINRTFTGKSSLIINRGKLDITLLENPKVFISATVTGGSIDSPIPYNVDVSGNLTSAEWNLGRAAEIRVQATNSTVDIQPRP